MIKSVSEKQKIVVIKENQKLFWLETGSYMNESIVICNWGTVESKYKLISFKLI